MKTQTKSTGANRLFIGILALAAAVFSLAGTVQAANPSTLDLKVTVAPALSIAVGTATYSFGSLGVNVTELSTGAIPVRNDSYGRTEDFRITGANSTNWTIDGSTNGVNTFYLRALLNSVQPTQAEFTAVNSALTLGIANMSAANHGGDQNGNNVTSNGYRNLWFMLGTPTETSFTSEQTITVTLTAADSSTY